MSKSLGKLVITSCQRNFGPNLRVSQVIDLASQEFQSKDVAIRLLLSEAGLILPMTPKESLPGIVDPIILV